nr:Arm DNA-binding domain-containing protein [uncultured Undibacterium sp.]
MLTDTSVKNAKQADKACKLYDEGGLFLLITPTTGHGGKRWRFKYRFDGKEKLLAFGAYPEVSLKDARNLRDEARKLLTSNQGPNTVKKAQNTVKQLVVESTFGAVAMEWFKIKIMPLSTSHSGDDATDKINRASDGNEYKFKLFENHLVEIRKNSPRSVSALNDFLVRD